MALSQELGIRAKVEPSVDRSSKRKLTQDVEDAISDAEGGVGGGIMDRTGPSGGGGAAGGAAGAGMLSGGGIGGAAKMLGTVALGGVVAAGMLNALESASGRLSGVMSIFGSMSKLFLKPFGDKVAEALLPFAETGLSMAKNFNDIYEKEGLLVAIGAIGTSAVKTMATGIGSAIGDILTGEGSAGDFLTVGLAGIGAAKLAGLLPSIGIGSILSRIGVSGLTKLLPSLGLGTILNPLTGSVLAALIGTISLADIIDGDISEWNFIGRFGQALGQSVRNHFPNAADIIQTAFTNNPVFDLGTLVGDLSIDAEQNVEERQDENPYQGTETSEQQDQDPESVYERRQENVNNAGGSDMSDEELQQSIDNLSRTVDTFGQVAGDFSDNSNIIEIDGQRVTSPILDEMNLGLDLL